MKILTLLIAALLMLSCGARKTNTLKSESEVKKDSVATENTNVLAVINTVKENEAETCTETYEPIDPSKPMVIDDGKGNIKTITNATKTSSNTKEKSKSSTQENTTTTTAKAAAVRMISKATAVAKATDREGNKSGLYIILSGVAVLFVLWLFILRKKHTNETDKI